MGVVVNIFGGAGVGKSTVSAELFAKLKKKGLEVEYVTEFAKDLVWEKRDETFKDQAYIFGKQYHRIFRVIDKVDIVVTDSPILLSAIYDVEQDEDLRRYILKKFNAMDNINIMLQRKFKYNPNGRRETEYEAKEVDKKISKFLIENNINHVVIPNSENIVGEIIDYMKYKQGEM